jgi:CysZ protein
MATKAAKTSPGFFHGLRTVPRALDVLRAVPQILLWLLIPLTLTLILDGLVLRYGYAWLHGHIRALLPNGSLGIVLDILAILILIFLLAWTFSFVFLTLCELVVDHVSEAVEQHLTGHPGSAAGLPNLLRGLGSSLLQALVAAVLGVVGILLNLIPVIGSIFSIQIAALLLGYGFFSVSAGRKVKSLSERMALLRAHISPIMGLGLVVFVVNLIPLVNLLALPVFVVAGTILFLDVTLPPAETPASPSSGPANPASPG